MTDVILTILGTSVYLPFLLTLFRTHWDKHHWSRQLLLLMLLLQGTAIMHIPSVMYISGVCLLVILFVYMIVERPVFHITPVFIVSLLYSSWYAISLAWSPSPQKGALFLMDNGLPLLGFALLGCTLKLNKEEYVNLLRKGCYVGLVFIGLSIVTWLVSCYEVHAWPWQWPILDKSHTAGNNPYKWVFRWLGGMNGYTHPSYNMLPLFAITGYAMWLHKKHDFSAILWWLMWVGSLVLTLIIQSRMGLIFAAVELFAYAIYMQSTIRRKIVAAGIIVALCTMAIGYSMDFWRQYGNDQNREYLTSCTWRYIQAKPWTGAGAGALNPIEICHTIGEDYWPHVGKISPDADAAIWGLKVHMLPHNQWLADASHGGVMAALCSLALYLMVAVRCVRERRIAESVFLLVFIIFSFLEPPLYIGKGLFLFCFITGVFYAESGQSFSISSIIRWINARA